MTDQIGDFIICPYCDWIFPDIYDYPKEEDIVNGMEMDCANCKRTFTVVGELHWTFQTYGKKENDNMAKTDKTFSTMNGDEFFVMLKRLLNKNKEMAFNDVVFEDENGVYHPIKKIVIDRKMALAMIALKESDELDVGDHEVKKEGE